MTFVEIKEATVEIDPERCKSCQFCVDVCPPDVLKISENLNTHGYHPAYYVGSGCTGCGVCFYACPEPGALRVYKKGAMVEA